MVVQSIAIKEETKNVVLIKIKYIKGEEHIALMDFAEHLRKSDVSENSKVFMVDIYEMDFMKGVLLY